MIGALIFLHRWLGVAFCSIEAAVKSAELARAIASDFAIGRQWAAPAISIAALQDYDQLCRQRCPLDLSNRVTVACSGVEPPPLVAFIACVDRSSSGGMRRHFANQSAGIAPCLALCGDCMRGIGSVSAAGCSC
jgi:hypothetical protein